MNPDHSQPEAPMPVVDYCETEAKLRRNFPYWESPDPLPISELPFQMFAYRVVENEKSTSSDQRETSESGSDTASAAGDDNVVLDEPFSPAIERKSVVSPDTTIKKKLSTVKKLADVKTHKQPGSLFPLTNN